jgi:predicted nuclease of predicted toxin-antitoxin system
VKLLFDENLSPRLVHLLSSFFPESTHVRNVSLASADNDSIWTYAQSYNFVIVSKDSDFHQRSFVKDQPPKVIWLRCGNRGTEEIADLLRRYQGSLEQFATDPTAAFIEVG